ncbi:hypothetical protein EB796_004207 [Bugula neritina]|uniref:Uncharacterized protein n=1 Tax=Bugula neritina TaxID=10212 RepID=A0A7J7KGX1_BUGNE|nr:hypothetical protein EB796_004207 [Bugula neritina]
MNQVKTEPVPHDICEERVKTTPESIDACHQAVELPNDVKVEYFELEEEEVSNFNSVKSFDGQEEVAETVQAVTMYTHGVPRLAGRRVCVSTKAAHYP